MCGTNDTGQGVTPAQFNQQLSRLIMKVREIGATPIIMSSWVGSADNPAYYPLSCDYYNLPYLHESKLLPTNPVTTTANLKLAAGESYILYVSNGSSDNLWVKSFACNSASLTVEIGRNTTLEPPVYNVQSFASNVNINLESTWKLSKPDGNFRFKVVSIKNDTAGEVTAIAHLTVDNHK